MHELLFRSICLLIAAWMVGKLVEIYWWKPRKIQKIFMEQGIAGPPYIPFIGSLAELAKIYAKAESAEIAEIGSIINNSIHLVFPHLPIWTEKYGKVFLYWHGRIPRLSISDPDLIKEFASTPGKYYQSIQHPLVYNLIGKSILASGGAAWITHRRLINPFFLAESLKGLPAAVVTAVEEKMLQWRSIMKSNEMELDMYEECKDLSQKIVAKIIFGNDVDEGMQIAKWNAEQLAINSKLLRFFYIPGTKLVPTSLNRRSRWLRKKVENKLRGLVERRLRDVNSRENDWLSAMLTLGNMTRQQIIDECSAILSAGSESTNILLAWACLHLGTDKILQDDARIEIDRVMLKENRPLIEILSHLKIFHMIVNETLRLYPPVPYVMKYSREDVKLGQLKIPAGVDIEVPIMSVHYDTSIWGDNAGQFDPSRFSNGVSKASKHPMAFMPFMQGPRICPGINFIILGRN